MKSEVVGCSNRSRRKKINFLPNSLSAIADETVWQLYACNFLGEKRIFLKKEREAIQKSGNHVVACVVIDVHSTSTWKTGLFCYVI